MADPALKTSKLAYQILGDVKKVSPKAGDVIVVEHKLPLATGDRMKVQKQFQSLGSVFLEWNILPDLKFKTSLNTIYSSSNFNNLF